jgi:hypothetical protein
VIGSRMAGGGAFGRRLTSSDARIGYQHFRVFVRGFPCLNCGRRSATGHKTFVGSSPTVAPPPVMHDIVGSIVRLYGVTCAG